jgi:hypothetical protein
MSEPQEWTENAVVFLMAHGGAKAIAAAHNAALAALRADQTQRMNSVQDFYSKQLADEREKVKELQESLSLDRITNENWKGIYEKKCLELADEREKVEVLVEALEKIRNAKPGTGRGELMNWDDIARTIDDALAKVNLTTTKKGGEINETE